MQEQDAIANIMSSSSIWAPDESTYATIRSQVCAIAATMAPSEAPARGCFGCGRMEAPSSTLGAVEKLRSCSKCLLARYCTSECQRDHWPSHKASCRALAAMRHGTTTGDTARPTSTQLALEKRVTLWRWYYNSVELLPLKVMCLAWQTRAKHAILRVRMIGGDVDSLVPIVTAVPRSEWGNEEVQAMYKKEDESMLAGALAMGVISDSANNFDPEKQFALFLDIGHMDNVGSPSTVESSIQTVTFKDHMDRLVTMYSMFTADTQEEAAAALSRTLAAYPSLSGRVFALLLTLVCTRYYLQHLLTIVCIVLSDSY